jgi:hypothetical protein
MELEAILQLGYTYLEKLSKSFEEKEIVLTS